MRHTEWPHSEREQDGGSRFASLALTVDASLWRGVVAPQIKVPACCPPQSLPGQSLLSSKARPPPEEEL